MSEAYYAVLLAVPCGPSSRKGSQKRVNKKETQNKCVQCTRCSPTTMPCGHPLGLLFSMKKQVSKTYKAKTKIAKHTMRSLDFYRSL